MKNPCSFNEISNRVIYPNKTVSLMIIKLLTALLEHINYNCYFSGKN